MRESPHAGPAPGPLAATAHTPSAPLLDEQNRRWREGDCVPVEVYLGQHPWLRSDAESLLDLIYNEIRLREELGETPELDDYCRRFPELAGGLAVQFEVHRALRPGQDLGDFSLAGYAEVAGSAPPPLPAVEGYELLGELGRGAMGVIYKARHLRLNRLVALKMILAGAYAGPRELARFETEAQAIARLQHPHIVQIHAIGEQDGRPFVCLELVPGGNLAQRLAGRPLPPRQAGALVEVLARAVHYAHEQQIVHRDLKPANVLLARSDPRRGILLGGSGEVAFVEPKITDFGLAKLLDGDPDAPDGAGSRGTAGPVGTPPYMAPEQVGRSGSGACARVMGGGRATDIYALGAILYETLTGRPPFMAATVYETLQQVCALEPVPPRRLQPQVPRDLETICLACLRKEPHRRYASALDLADDLRRFLEGRPIRQRPPAAWEPALKWARRRPAAAAWVVLGAAALVALAVSSLYYLQHCQEWARQRALNQYQQFVRRRDEALFQGTLLAAVRLAPQDRAVTDLRATREAARDALTLAGVGVDGGSGPARDDYLTPAQQSDLTNSCHDLLMVLSEALDQPLPGVTPEEQRRQAAEALGVLDRASQLGPPTRAFCLCRARVLARQGDHAGADAERRLAEALQPVSASDYYFTGVDQYREGDTARAVHSFRETLRLRPNHFEAQCFLAICSLNAGRPGEAQVGLTACIGQRPGFAWSYLLRGFAAVQQEAYADAEMDFTTALDLDPNGAVRYAVNANRGLLRLRQGKVAEAVVDLETAVALRPDECQAHLTLAQAFQRQMRFADAAREIDTAVRLRPDLPLVHRARGQLHLEQRGLDAAVRDFETAVRLEPAGSSSPALVGDYLECGRIRHMQNRFQDAVAAYDHVLRIRPDHAPAHHLRGEALLELNRPQEAERAFGQCLEHDPVFGPALRARGQARVRLGDFAGAVEDYTRALQLQRDASILTHRGWAYFFTDAWKLAERDFDEAIRLDARPGDAHVGRGLARVMLGDYRRAIADVNTVLRQNKPETPEMMHNVACVYALAAGRVRADAGEGPCKALEAEYRRQALAALRKTLLLVAPGQRLAFWQEKMCPDTALDAIRQSAEFVQLNDQVRQESARAERIRKTEPAQPR
jgi:serine/threonine protein kinase/Flp pilus assembly protein TadD